MFVRGHSNLLADEVFDFHFLSVGIDDLGGGIKSDLLTPDGEFFLFCVVGRELTGNRDFDSTTGVDGTGESD